MAHTTIVVIISILVFGIISSANCDGLTADFDKRDLLVQIGETKPLTVILSGQLSDEIYLYITYQEDGKPKPTQDKPLLKAIPEIKFQPSNETQQNATINITGIAAGHIFIGINSSSSDFENKITHYCRVGVQHYQFLNIVSDVVGWVYFVAWTVSFYPQFILNCVRRSVAGLNLDFITYNVLGFVAYSAFNVGLYWIPSIQEAYHKLHPRGVNPVQLNDVIFSLHAVLLTILTAIQCCCLERRGQKVSRICIAIMAVLLLFIAITFFLAFGKVITWLDYLYYFSYVKLFITLIKYMPQAYMNFRRKSTEGWSIGNVLLDFTGGFLSILQMFIISYNYNDWDSIFGDPTKFGLGLFSVAFDILFIFQHYCCYRNAPSLERERISVQDEEDQPLLYST